MNTRHHSPSPDAQRGLTLIELMISMVLGLLLMLGVVNVYLSQVQSYRVNDNLGQLQNSARTAFELLAREIREAGGIPCGAPIVVDDTGSSGSDWRNWNEGGLVGFTGDDDMEGIDIGDEEAERVEDTDGISIRSASYETPIAISGYDAPTRTYTALSPTAPDFKADEDDKKVLVVCDYSRATVFEASAIIKDTSDPERVVTTITHPATAGPYPSSAQGFASRLTTTAWYIGNNGTGGRSLYRVHNGKAADEIAAGVVGMELSYLTRTGNTLASDYVEADDIASWTNDAASPVVAVRIVLDLESRDAVGTDGEPLKQQMQHVVALRHREIIL